LEKPAGDSEKKRDQNPGALRDQGQEVSHSLEKPAAESEEKVTRIQELFEIRGKR
jgi:hypothetical protein